MSRRMQMENRLELRFIARIQPFETIPQHQQCPDHFRQQQQERGDPY